METVLGQLTEAQFHEFGHLTELRNLYEHMMETFWLKVQQDWPIPNDSHVRVDEKGQVVLVGGIGMIIVAIVLVAIATILIAVDWVRNAYVNFGTLGLAFLSGGVLAYLIWCADEAGKL